MAKGVRGRGKGPAPEQIAKFGHIAALLRGYMQQHSMTPADLNQAAGNLRSYTGVYGWLNAKGAPGPKAAAKLAKLLGVPPSELQARSLNGPPREQLPARVTTAPKAADVLQFSIDAAGMTRIRLDIQLPVAQGGPLLRMLLDAGLVLGE